MDVLEVKVTVLADGLLVGTGDGEKRSRTERFSTGALACRAGAGAGLQPGAGYAVSWRDGARTGGRVCRDSLSTGEPEYLGVLSLTRPPAEASVLE